MLWIFSLAVIFTATLYLLILLNKEIIDKYTWQKQVIYKDYLYNEEIRLITSSESLAVSSLNKDDYSKEALISFEEILSNLTNSNIPFRVTFMTYIGKFLEDKNIFTSLSIFDENTIKLFSNELKLEGPSFFIEKNIYNIYVQYSIFKEQSCDTVVISNELDYLNFLKDLYKYNNNFTCKVNYIVYKQVGKDEKADKACSLSLITNIGPSYANINYNKSFLIHVSNFSDF